MTDQQQASEPFNPFTDPATTERTVALLRRMYRRYLDRQRDEQAMESGQE